MDNRIHFHREKFTRAQIRTVALTAAGFVLLTAAGLACSALLPEEAAAAHSGSSPLILSEYMSSNSAIPDDTGEFSDWVEIVNRSDGPVSLRGYALINDQKAGSLPDTTLPAGGCLLVYCDGTRTAEAGALTAHVPFRLKAAGGEELSLRAENGAIVDTTTTLPLDTNVSAVRQENAFTASSFSTPGYPNTEEGLAAYKASRVVEQSDLLLNEILPGNTVTMPAADGNYYDAIEIRNASDKAIDLTNYGLTNDKEEPLKWRFPARTLEPGQVLVVFASGKALSPDLNELHASFKLNRSADALYLCSPDGRILDSVEINGVGNDIALRRDADGQWSRTASVSLGYPNTDEGVNGFWEAVDKGRMGLRISEVMPRNNTITCIAGRKYAWLELHNPTDQPISLKGYTLSNDPDNPGLFALPDVTIPAGGYRAVYLTGGQVSTSSSYIQANFKPGDDDSIALYSPDGKLADGVGLANIPINASKGRRDSGGAGFFLFTSPTLGAANGTGGERDATAVPAATKAGVYEDVQSVKVSLSGEGTIYYTTDGSEPTVSSTRYAGPFELTATTAVRAIAVKEGAIPSDILTVSYIINEHHTLDVVSLVTPPDGFFGYENGIYALGPGKPEYPNDGANFWNRGPAWERAANVELFPQDPDDPGFSIGCGVRIFGGMSRSYEKKSLSIRFKDCYGAGSLDYPVFDSRDNMRYESLLLRSTGQDRLRSLMKDAFNTSLVDDAGTLLTQAYRPIILYINGQYWGIYYIREKIDADFIAAHDNVSPESVDLLKGDVMVKEGSDADYRKMIQFIEDLGGNLSDDKNYDAVAAQMDVTNFADFIIAEMYLHNRDEGNIRFYRSRETDNKWRWILYDTDMTLEATSESAVWDYINPAGMGAGNAFSTTLLRGLLTNAQFRALFLERLEFNMKNTFSTQKALARLEEFHAFLQPEVARNFERYEAANNWESWMKKARQYIENRQAAMKKEFLAPEAAAVFHYTEEQLNRCFE